MFLKLKSFILLLSASFCLASIPQTTQKCKISDSKCMLNTVNQIFKNKTEGIPEMGLVSLDPMNIDEMIIQQGGNSPVSITLHLKNNQLFGLHNAEFYKITGFTENADVNKVELRLKTPKLDMRGPYDGKGKVLILPIYGTGNSNISMENIDIKVKFLTKKFEKEGKVYAQIDKFKIDFDTTRLNVMFTGLFNGDKALGDNMNLFLNDNWKILLDELKPSIITAFSKLFKEIVDSVFTNTPYEELFEH